MVKYFHANTTVEDSSGNNRKRRLNSLYQQTLLYKALEKEQKTMTTCSLVQYSMTYSGVAYSKVQET